MGLQQAYEDPEICSPNWLVLAWISWVWQAMRTILEEEAFVDKEMHGSYTESCVKF